MATRRKQAGRLGASVPPSGRPYLAQGRLSALRRAGPWRLPGIVIRAGVWGVYLAARGLMAADRHRRPAAAAPVLLVLGILFWMSLPRPLFQSPYSTVALARDGRLLGARIAADGQWRFPAAPCPPRFAAAVMAFEDSRFRWHPGVDPLAVLRAAAKNAKSGRVVSGASTLTMQVVRLSRQGRPRTFLEKLKESLLAVRLELALSKDEILALYASHAPFGGNVVGLTAASWRWFGRGPESLSWGEAALLAVLPNSPSLMHPGRNREPLRRKRDHLLTRMWHEGLLDSVSCALARLEPLPDKPQPLPSDAPHLVQRLAASGPGPSGAGSSGAGSPLARTTVDADLQARVSEVLARRRRALEGAGIRNGAVLILETRTGAVLAYAGNLPPPRAGEGAPADGFGAGPGHAPASRDFRAPPEAPAPRPHDPHGRDVDIIMAPRSTGSLLKPFLYAVMLEAGEILPGTLVPDVPTHIGGFAPENFDRGYEGAVPARMALARSLNVPAVRMLKEYGIERFLHDLRRLGLTTLNRSAGDYGLTLVLGGAEGTLWELAGLYAGLGREALRYAEPRPDNADRPSFFPPHLLPAAGGPGAAPPEDGFRPIGPGAAWLALQAMAEASRPDAEQHWRSFASSRWVAWKTGTSFGFRDAWAVGVTPEFTVGVWIGNADGQGRPGMTGIQAAAPVLFEAFNLLPASTGFPMPMASLRRIPVCRQSGMRPAPECPQVDTAWAPEAGVRSLACPYHRLAHLDPSGRRQVHDGCHDVASMRHEPWFVLPPAQEWHYRQRHSDYRPLPPWRSGCEDGAVALSGRKSMDLVYPRGSAQIYVPVQLDSRRGRTVFEAVHRDPSAVVYWHLDREYMGQTQEFHKVAVDPAPGRHVLLLVDNKGERLEHRFEVLARESSED